ncbi:hypothetical protein HLV40_07310 [Chromohalobacter salexigens]|nr:hypothetical protein [Chromohalobacter salexigens]
MKERPILFSGEMVRAILDGRKTQTRRAMKPQPTVPVSHFRYIGYEKATGRGDWQACDKSGKPIHAFHKSPFVTEIAQCPYGKPGDRLWVRETFGYGARPCPFEGGVDGIEYRADEAYIDDVENLPLYTPPTPEDFCYGDVVGGGWKPSIHMPRWASRIDLEITAIRVERLQDISADDARSEGIQTWIDSFKDGPRYHENGQLDAYPVSAFSRLWKSINGADSWDANPWVWVVEFRVIEPGEVAA